MGVIYTMERHHELLSLWREQGSRSLRVTHLDFHCDMRGMLVDRRSGRAYRIRDRFSDLDQGNFLTHAVLEGRIEAIRWVHDDPGGRLDDIGTVKLESDITALPYRLIRALRKDEGVPLTYDVVRSADWTGLRPGERLDIDWDYFASLEYDIESIPQRVERFWQDHSAVVPAEVYICYSPEYSHPTRDLFADFVADLADRFDSTVVARPAPTTEKPPNERSASRFVPASAYAAIRDGYHRLARGLKKRGIY